MAGVAARTPLRACVAGPLVALSALLAYYVAQHVLGQESWGDVWPAFNSLAFEAIFMGLVFGVMGSFAISSSPWRHAWRMAIPGALAIEAAVTLTVNPGADRLLNGLSVAELVSSCVIVVGLAAAFVTGLSKTRPGGWLGAGRTP